MRRLLATLVPLVLVAVAWAALSPELDRALHDSKYVYIQSERKGGAQSKAAEIWFYYDGKAVYVGTPPTTFRVKRIKAGRKKAHIAVGNKQEFIFRETDKKLPEYDGHHIQVYVQDFSGGYNQLMKRDLLTEESNAYQYRWENITDLDTGEVLFEIEHEIRSMTHPLYMRPLVNRNPMQSQQSYEMGGDEWDWQLRRSNVRLPDVPAPTGPSAKAYATRRATRMAQAM